MAKSSNKEAAQSEKLTVRRIGYARVSTADQNPDMQIAALEAYCVKCGSC
nr:recombinase family protein [Thioclava dalianensis]